ncbi:Response regulator ArlR [bioreactor metagenome]|uniref:Response regulator ArlR n=1 Tax=bioreactor metagenome TaxID=1076179 RepID=A0A645G4W0_9ZZZZ
MELLSRIRALLRRRDHNKKPEEKLLSFDGVILDYEKRIVMAGDTRCILTFKEFELLYYLLKNVNIVLSREKIMEAVWGFDFEGESRTVDMHIGTLRQKLGEYGQIIQTIRGVGYKIGG